MNLYLINSLERVYYLIIKSIQPNLCFSLHQTQNICTCSLSTSTLSVEFPCSVLLVVNNEAPHGAKHYF